MKEFKHSRRLLLLGGLAGLGSLGACAWRVAPSDAAQATAWQAGRDAALAAAVPMPAGDNYRTHYLDWTDASRQRPVASKLYLPKPDGPPCPLLVFSHGLGGSRDGYSYIGKYLAAQGYACLHLQHVGSDRAVWQGNPLAVVSRLQAAAQESEAVHRVHDLRFALDSLLNSAYAAAIDPTRIAAAGHSYGANTCMLACGAQVERPHHRPFHGDPRIRATVLISAPPFYGQDNLQAILSPVQVPSLHITATNDDIIVPGYQSPAQDRIAVFDAMGGRPKTLAVFRDGSHSMFTDRLNTGGLQWNPRVKQATRELIHGFLRRTLDQAPTPYADWTQRHHALLARFDSQT